MRIPTRFLLELAAFAALAWYTAAHWTSGLIADAPGGRVFACIVIACAVGVALKLSEGLRGAYGLLLRGGCVIAGLGAGFVAGGLERKFLAPAHWDELGDGLDRGFAALGSVDWPYAGPEPWAELILVLAVPLVLTVAAALAFWPRTALRPFALVLLIALYGVAVTEHEFDGELARGVMLLLLTAVWLWLPRMPERGWSPALAAGGVVLVACVAALPAAARYEDSEPIVDYESWNPFAADAATRFDWSHNYGPIDWPRDGTTMMNVRSNERHYWKLETLDRFDGVRWERSGSGRGNNPLLPSPYKVAWESDFRVTIRDLDTNLFPIAGTALQIRGADPVIVPSYDGTLEALGESLDEGDSYSVDAYVPNPTPGEMRAATDEIPFAFQQYTETGPLPEEYAPVERLAQRLARGQPTTYDVVRSVQRYLRDEYTYNETAARAQLPAAGLPAEGPDRLLPALLGRDGLDAAHARHTRARRGRLHARVVQRRHEGVPRARPRCALVGRGVVVGHRLGAVRSDAVDRSGRLPVERRGRIGVRGLDRRRRGVGRAQPAGPGCGRRWRFRQRISGLTTRHLDGARGSDPARGGRARVPAGAGGNPRARCGRGRRRDREAETRARTNR